MVLLILEMKILSSDFNVNSELGRNLFNINFPLIGIFILRSL